jgi:hypothetical protein
LRVAASGWALLALGWAGAASAQAQDGAPPKPARPVQGLTVTAERPKTQTQLDRQVYTVTGNLQTTTGSAADVLNEVPAIDVDVDGNLTLRGDPNVTILIDGKPSAQFTGPNAGLALQQFPASQIDRIEVMTNPPAQYKAAGSGGVVNIVTKKGRTPGLSGVLRGSGGEFGRAVAGLDLTFNEGPIKGSAGVAVRHDLRVRISTSNRLETDPVSGDETQSFESIDERFNRLIVSETARIDDALNARQSVGGVVSYSALDGHRFFIQRNTGGPPGAAIDIEQARLSDGYEWHMDASEEGHFEQRLRSPDESLRFSIQRSLTRERENYSYINTFALPAASPTFDDLHLGNDIIATEFAADYELHRKDADLKLGYDYEHDENGFDNVGHTIDPMSRVRTIDPAVSNHFRYDQRIDALYGEYERPLGRWDLQAGLRAEAANVSFLLITGGMAGGRRDFGVYPSLHLDRASGARGKLSLGVSRRINRPDPEALNPFADHQDTHNLRAGNPNLLPQDTWKLDAGYTFADASFHWSATAFFRHDRNSFTSVEEPLGNGVVLITNENLPQSQSGGLDFSVGGKLGSKLSYELSGEAFYTQIDARTLGAAGLSSTVGLNLKASLDYRPTSLDLAQISLSHTGRRLTPQGSVAPIDLVNIGYKHQLRPDLAIVATVSDAFDGQKFRRFATAPGLTDHYLRYQVGHIAFAGLVYTFGGPSKGKATDFQYEP